MKYPKIRFASQKWDKVRWRARCHHQFIHLCLSLNGAQAEHKWNKPTLNKGTVLTPSSHHHHTIITPSCCFLGLNIYFMSNYFHAHFGKRPVYICDVKRMCQCCAEGHHQSLAAFLWLQTDVPVVPILFYFCFMSASSQLCSSKKIFWKEQCKSIINIMDGSLIKWSFASLKHPWHISIYVCFVFVLLMC